MPNNKSFLYCFGFACILFCPCKEHDIPANNITTTNSDSIFSALSRQGFKDSAVHTAFAQASVLRQQKNWKAYAGLLLMVSDSGFIWNQKNIQLSALDTLLLCEKQLAADTSSWAILSKAIYIWTGNYFDYTYNDSIVERMKTVWQMYQSDTSLSREAFMIANKLGISYNIAGDYPQAQYYYRQCYLDDIKRMKKTKLASDVINGTILLIELKNYDSAIALINNTLCIPGLLAKQQSSLYANLANAYAGKKQFDSAKKPLQKGIAILDTMKDKSALDERYATLYSVKAAIQQSQQQYAAAIKTLQLRLAYTIRTYDNSSANRYVGKVFIDMADNFYLLNQFDSALYYYHKALQTVITVNVNVLSLPLSKDIYAENTIMDALDGKAKTLTALYHQQHKQILAQTALDCYNLAFTAENKLLAMYDYDQSKLLQLQSSKSRSEMAIALCNVLYIDSNNARWNFMALQFAEKSKAIVLLQSIKKNLAAKNLSANDTLLSKANSLQLRITRKEAALHEAFINNSSEVNKLDSERTKLTGQLQLLQSQIKNIYPQLSRSISIEDTLTEGAIKKNILNKDAALVEYFKGDSAAYAFYIANSGACIMLRLDKNIDSSIIAFTQFFRQPETIANDPAAYQSSAENMYRQLFPFTTLTITPRTIIIPDGDIGYIPFDALITSATTSPNLKQFNYLIRQTNITQGYSITSLMQKDATVKGGLKLAAFAPAFTNGERNLTTLSFSKEELASIENEFSNGKYFLYQEATINALRSKAQHSGLLHIATHASAVLENSEPKIEMIDSTLTLSELYTWHIHAHLVTLSACETGIGNIEKSEGPMSLARGFYYAGAQNVITSLWQVNDAATGNIFSAFYKDIQSNPLAASLQKSKLQYIENTSNANASPYYWSGFIFIGSSDYQLPSQSNNWLWFAIIISTAITLLIIFLLRKKK